MSSTQRYVVTRQKVAALIGGLNGREPFMAYLLRKAQFLASNGAAKSEVIAMVKAEHRFWSKLLKAEMQRYDLMRHEEGGGKQGYALVHFEFNDLFRYCEDPVTTFRIDIGAPLTAAATVLVRNGWAVRDIVAFVLLLMILLM